MWCHHGIRPQEAKLTKRWSDLVNDVARKRICHMFYPPAFSIICSPLMTWQHHPQNWRTPQSISGNFCNQGMRQPIAACYTLTIQPAAPQERAQPLPLGHSLPGCIAELLLDLLCPSLVHLHANRGEIIQRVTMRAWWQQRWQITMDEISPGNQEASCNTGIGTAVDNWKQKMQPEWKLGNGPCST